MGESVIDAMGSALEDGWAWPGGVWAQHLLIRRKSNRVWQRWGWLWPLQRSLKMISLSSSSPVVSLRKTKEM